MYSLVFPISIWLIVHIPSSTTPSWMMSSGVFMSPSTRAVDDALDDDARCHNVGFHAAPGADLELVDMEGRPLEPAVDAEAPVDGETAFENGLLADR
jgi:hypothetical protein